MSHMKTDKKNKQQFIDDGRVIASMDIDGVPGAVFRRPKVAVDSGRSIDKKDPITLTGREKLAAAGGILVSYLLIALVVFGGLALFILFCTKVWFR